MKVGDVNIVALDSLVTLSNSKASLISDFVKTAGLTGLYSLEEASHLYCVRDPALAAPFLANSILLTTSTMSALDAS